MGLIVFGAASLAASFAQDTNTLIAMRGLQGVGAAFMLPATLSIISNVFERQERAKAIAIWAMVGALAAVALPLSVEWGYGLIAAVTGLALVSYLAGSRRSRRVDTPVETDRSDGQLGFWRRDGDDLG